MSDDIHIDTSELDRLAADLGTVPSNAGKNVIKAVQVGAGNVKKGWKDRVKDSRGISDRSISYDLHGDASATRSEVTAEIGPSPVGRKGTQAALVGMLEMGNTRMAPHGFGLAALQDEQPDFERGLEKAIDDALKAAGL